jgi:predicted RNA-binding Zn-ribbon protein involved in translation (DUF1610 family)
MRIPWRKLHRAFPELDAFSDAECQDMIKRVMQRSLWGTLLASGAAIGLCMFVVFVCLVAAVIARRAVSVAWELEVIGTGLAVGCGLGVMSGLLVRDVFVRSTMQKWILTARCTSCAYTLIGLHAERGRITCPECGLSNDLVARGLDPTTLVPRVPA